MQTVALGVYLQTTTHNPLWLGLTVVTGWLPALVGAPLGGAWAEQRSRTRIIRLCNLVMTATAAALAILVVTNHLKPWWAVSILAIEGFAGSASWASWQAILPDLVGEGEVYAAVSLSSAQFNLGRIVGPIAAGVLLAAGSPAWCFVVNAASFVAMVVAFGLVKVAPRRIVRSDRSIWRDIQHGAKTAWATAGCRNPITIVFLMGITASPFISFVPAMAIDVLHAGKTGTSWLVAGQGVGAVAMAVVAPDIAKRVGRYRLLRAALVIQVLSLAAYGLAPNLWWSVGIIVVVGAAYVAILTGLNTAVQMHAPTAERSRILSLYTLSLSVGYPIGAFVQGAIAHQISLRYVTEGSAVALGLLVIASSLWRKDGFIRRFTTDGGPAVAQ
jgi:MFS family permease